MSARPDDAETGLAAPLYLKKGQERRLRFGHPWIFSNEVDIARTPLRDFAAGDPVDLRSQGGASLGAAYVNPNTLICARIVSRRSGEHLDAPMLTRRIEEASRLRASHFPTAFYRLVYGESDALPGLVVDRYGDVLVAQLTTAGMERVRDAVVAALVAAVQPRAILLKNDVPARTLEGLEPYREVVHGRLPDVVSYEEHGARFEIAPGDSQKTGWYFDHRRNRARLLPRVRGRRVLDLFCYTGAWGIQAAVAGAREVVCVDTSSSALEQVEHHARLNGVEGRVRTLRADAFQALRELRSAGERFDIVIADPPAFIRRKKDTIKGLEAYRRLNGLAMQLLGDGGLLVSASCSFHLSRDKQLELLARVSSGVGRRAVVLEEGGQDVDHPVHPGLPESSYLKAFFVRVSD